MSTKEKIEWIIAYVLAWCVWLGTIPALLMIGELLGGLN